jgi:hypothetical protein
LVIDNSKTLQGSLDMNLDDQGVNLYDAMKVFIRKLMLLETIFNKDIALYCVRFKEAFSS